MCLENLTLESVAAAKTKDFSNKKRKTWKEPALFPSSSVPGALLLVEAHREPSGTAWLRRNVVVDSLSYHHTAWHKRAF